MLAQIAAKLDVWVIARNIEARAEGLPQLRPCLIRVLGQAALLEAHARLQLNVTNDVDVYADYDHAIELEFRRLLALQGKELDPVGREVWMPKETVYKSLFAGEYVSMELADVDAVLASKALKAPDKNRSLIVEYLAAGATPRFLAMAERYAIDLERFV